MTTKKNKQQISPLRCAPVGDDNKKNEQQISPIRCASVGMTIGRAFSPSFFVWLFAWGSAPGWYGLRL
jgi:hypothetical protein